MGYTLTCPQLITDVREKIADRDGGVWTDARILARADQELQRLWNETRTAGRDHDMHELTIQTGSLISLASQQFDWTPPEYVAHVRQIEAVIPGSAGLVAIPQAELHTKDTTRLTRGQPSWHRGPNGVVRFLGNVTTWPQLRVWYLRKWPPLHYGTAPSGSTTTMVLDNTPIGSLVRRTDAYLGARFQLLGGANQDIIVTATAFDRSTRAITFTPAVSALAADTDYSMVVPLEAEHSGVVTIATAMNLLQSGGNTDYVAALMPMYAEAKQNFLVSVATRDQDAPRTIWYTDR